MFENLRRQWNDRKAEQEVMDRLAMLEVEIKRDRERQITDEMDVIKREEIESEHILHGAHYLRPAQAQQIGTRALQQATEEQAVLPAVALSR